MIAANQADASILAVADTAMAYPSIAHFNGDDAMILLVERILLMLSVFLE